MAYTKEFVTALEFVWGEGFLSPGGSGEVQALIGDRDLRGARILDFGSGLGGIDVFLAESFGAAAVVGIDVAPDVIPLARQLAQKRNVSDRVSFIHSKPGPLDFADGSFDVVFSKDAMVHVEDKAALYRDIVRVLRPGGQFIASDWLWKPGAATDPLVRAWIGDNPLGFVFTTVAEAVDALAAAGFRDIDAKPRHSEIAALNRLEVARLEGPALGELVTLVGEDVARGRLHSAKARQPVLDAAALIPTHLYGRKP